MNNKELTEYIGISEPTIYAWKKNKVNLYNIIMNWKSQNKNILSTEEENLLKLFNKLTQKEKEMYIAEIKARILRKELDEN